MMSVPTPVEYLKTRTDKLTDDLASRDISLFTYRTRLAEYMSDYDAGITEESDREGLV